MRVCDIVYSLICASKLMRTHGSPMSHLAAPNGPACVCAFKSFVPVFISERARAAHRSLSHLAAPNGPACVYVCVCVCACVCVCVRVCDIVSSLCIKADAHARLTDL